jgi:cyclophilin family peptidyl-prolyl cis-trans isomerase
MYARGFAVARVRHFADDAPPRRGRVGPPSIIDSFDPPTHWRSRALSGRAHLPGKEALAMRRTLNLNLLAFAVSAALLLSGCGGGTESSDSATEEPPANIGAPGNIASPTSLRPVDSPGLPPTIGTTGQDFAPRPKRNLRPVVTIKTSLGDITVRLDAEKAPQTVDNFLDSYVGRGFYDQTVFHYVDSGFMIAAGGFAADLSPKTPRAEILNEAHNGLKNLKYTIAMARNPDYANSATSQFYINLVDNAALDYVSDESAATYGYCVFGEVIEGREVVDQIAKSPVHDQGEFIKTPVQPVVIQTVVRVE